MEGFLIAIGITLVFCIIGLICENLTLKSRFERFESKIYRDLYKENKQSLFGANFIPRVGLLKEKFNNLPTIKEKRIAGKIESLRKELTELEEES